MKKRPPLFWLPTKKGKNKIMSTTNIPAIQKTLADYCAIREQTLDLLRDAQRSKDAAEALFKTAYTYGLPYDRGEKIEKLTKEVDSRLWRQAFDLTGFLELMDREALSKFNNDRDPAPFTIDNVRATFLTLFQSADDMFARGLVNVFRRLDKYYRTNDQAFKLERKVVLTYMFQVRWSRGLQVHYGDGATGTLNDLDRVFHVLDGQKHSPRRLETALNAAFECAGPWVYEDDYFQVKGYRNGNAHIVFKRADLIEKANKVIGDYYGGRAIPKAA